MKGDGFSVPGKIVERIRQCLWSEAGCCRKNPNIVYTCTLTKIGCVLVNREDCLRYEQFPSAYDA